MNRKKIVAIVLGLVWLILIIDRVYMSGKDKTIQFAQTPATKRRVEATTQRRDISYPSLSISIKRTNLFADTFSPVEDKKVEKEVKKVVTLPAPPLPILPEPKYEQEKNIEEIHDQFKEIAVVGVLDKKTKKMAFIKYKKEIKPFYNGDFVFDTQFFVEKITSNVVILKNSAGVEKKLEIIKEEKDDKK